MFYFIDSLFNRKNVGSQHKWVLKYLKYSLLSWMRKKYRSKIWFGEGDYKNIFFWVWGGGEGCAFKETKVVVLQNIWNLNFWFEGVKETAYTFASF